MPFQAHVMAMKTIPALKGLVKAVQMHDPVSQISCGVPLPRWC
jgi:hypothetical protein